MAAEAERVAQGEIDLGFAGLKRDKIHLETAFRVRILQVYRGGNGGFGDGLYTNDKLDRAAGAEKMADAALGRADRNLSCTLAEDGSDSRAFR